MKPVIFLRIASVLTFIHAVLHTIGGVFSSPDPGPQQTAVSAMKANTFQVFGATRSYWDFHIGFGLAVSIFLTAEAIVFWQLASMAKTDALRLRPILITFMVAYLVFAVVSWTYFFPPPVITEVFITLCLGGAIATSKSTATAVHPS
ncbi:MAG TPA: hypothetical protein VIX90_15945 [Edaphobacter sp.]